MKGKASLTIPSTAVTGPFRVGNISDALALDIGRAAAWGLSEQDGYVIVTLESGKETVIGHDTLGKKLVIGHLTRPYRYGYRP